MSTADGFEALVRGIAARGGVEDLRFAQVDHDRAERCGFPEVVFCPGKSPAEAAAIAAAIAARAGRVLCTRVDAEQATALLSAIPGAAHHPRARTVSYEREPRPRFGKVAVVAAGTADLPVAEEAMVTADALGCAVELHADLGVAGLHRLLARLQAIRAARVVIAVAGMEGALPSVLAGLVASPVIAVPTSTGYGVGLGGLAALGTMLNSCAAGVTCVNIDNGFGAGYAAALVNRAGETGPGS